VEILFDWSTKYCGVPSISPLPFAHSFDRIFDSTKLRIKLSDFVSVLIETFGAVWGFSFRENL
jgi:hypothetical protein